MERERILYDWEKDEKISHNNKKTISESTNEDAMVRMLAEKRRQELNNNTDKEIELIVNKNHYEKTNKPALKNNTQVPIKKTSGKRQNEMIKKSTDGRITNNKRSKTKVKKNWKNIAISVSLSVMLASSMTAGGLLATPIEDFTNNLENKWKLGQMENEFLEVVERYTTPNFANDEEVDYRGLASYIDKDGKVTNQELFTAVKSIGEVETNRIMYESKYSPAKNIENYMKDNNIQNISDWENKTLKEMALENDIKEKGQELQKIFEDEPVLIDDSKQMYGGK